METALRYELETKIDELKPIIDDGEEIGFVFPTNAPEGATKSYLVYVRITTKKVKTLEGYTGNEALSYMFSIMATRYEEMTSLRKKVENLLLSLPGKEIGDTDKIYIEDLDINNIDEQYEHELKVNRGIIDFTIYF